MAGLGATFAAVAIVGGHIDLVRSGIDAPPFYGFWRNGLGWRIVAPIAVAGIVIVVANYRDRVAWPWVLGCAVAAAVAWSAALGFADSMERLTRQFHTLASYTRGVDTIGNHPGHYLDTFTEAARGPTREVIRRGYPIHVQGHPPGAVLTLWAVTRLGLGAVPAAIVLVWSGMAATVVGVLQTVRHLAGEPVARAAAPFVVMLPAAVWSHTFDSYFSGIAALAVWATVWAIVPKGRSSTRRVRPAQVGVAVVGGVLFGYLALMSYGLVLVAIVPTAVAWRLRRLVPLVVAGTAAVVTMALPLAWGFSWFAGLATTHHQYVQGVSRRRPYGYFVVANATVTAVAVGPAALAGALVVGRRWLRDRTGSFFGAGALILGSFAALVAADVSGLAKAEVERIFQPLYPWLALAAIGIAAAPGKRVDRLTRIALLCQAAVAIALATQLKSPW